MVSEKLIDVGKVLVGAAAGILSTLLLMRARRREALHKRRMEIRAPLVRFIELVRGIHGGEWPSTMNDVRDWMPVYGNVRAHRLSVVQVMDLDRPTAGRGWCKKVDRCLQAGSDLVHATAGDTVGISSLGRTSEQVTQRLASLRAAFDKAYRKVT